MDSTTCPPSTKPGHEGAIYCTRKPEYVQFECPKPGCGAILGAYRHWHKFATGMVYPMMRIPEHDHQAERARVVAPVC